MKPGALPGASWFTELVAKAPSIHLWVIGDLMLDEYVVGDVGRISPDAPVQVVNIQDTYDRLGGAANVANNIAALGARVTLGGIVGNDAHGQRLLDACQARGIGTHGVLRLDGHPTTAKTRVLSRGQQLLRLDREVPRPPSPTELSRLTSAFASGPRPHAIVLSDYKKGVLSPALIQWATEQAASLNVPLLLDPKQTDFSLYRGASILTPNLKEVEQASGFSIGNDDSALRRAAAQILSSTKASALLVTLGERGMALFEPGGVELPIPSAARDVFDVTGAGDTVIATLAVFLACGASLADAAHLANVAAGIVVGKVGTATVSPADLARSIADERADKLFSRERAATLCNLWRLQGRRIVFTNGCFDILHVGHASLLREARAQGDLLVVGLNSDSSVRGLKGPTRPVIAEAERAALLAALDCVDGVCVFDEATPEALIQAIRPDVIVKGGDYRPDQVVGADLVAGWGGRVHIVPLVEGKSTSAIVDRMSTPAAGSARLR